MRESSRSAGPQHGFVATFGRMREPLSAPGDIIKKALFRYDQPLLLAPI
jgi:hypothetical protein